MSRRPSRSSETRAPVQQTDVPLDHLDQALVAALVRAIVAELRGEPTPTPPTKQAIDTEDTE